jgi:hypothetical protein
VAVTKRNLISNSGGLVLMVGLVIGAYAIFRPQSSPIPKDINQKISHSIFVPAQSSGWRLDKTATSYNNDTGVLNTYLLSRNNRITMTQQNTPQTFKDVPTYYPALLNKLHEYSEIQTSNGTVGLTKPDELKGGQSAVANISDTLMFLHPDHDLTDQQWKQLFNNLDIVK